MSNLVAMALTLAGPRLWILIKAFNVGIYQTFRRSCRTLFGPHNIRAFPGIVLSSISPHPRIPNSSAAQHHSRSGHGNPSHSLTVMEESHSELGAARDLTSDALRQLQATQIELPVSHRRAAQ